MDKWHKVGVGAAVIGTVVVVLQFFDVQPSGNPIRGVRWETLIVAMMMIATWGAVFIGLRLSKRRGQQVPAVQGQQRDDSSQFLKAADFYKTFDNPVLRDIEPIVRSESEKYEPGSEQEDYLVRAMASIIVIAAFDVTYRDICGSQLRALNELNGHEMTVDQLQFYFEEGLLTVPDVFRDRSFDQWLAFF